MVEGVISLQGSHSLETGWVSLRDSLLVGAGNWLPWHHLHFMFFFFFFLPFAFPTQSPILPCLNPIGFNNRIKLHAPRLFNLYVKLLNLYIKSSTWLIYKNTVSITTSALRTIKTSTTSAPQNHCQLLPGNSVRAVWASPSLWALERQKQTLASFRLVSLLVREVKHLDVGIDDCYKATMGIRNLWSAETLLFACR